ncbi:hypothetical protein [Actinoplanes sp. L3-i22]|uniref:hypothetical protein n=1 Tax=Actinoplanes sp. L3-i22 TaxID=2836373 RepID=UPI001C86264A|nr:hypothetical protein [Actinoplanes sp. L3-i22]
MGGKGGPGVTRWLVRTGSSDGPTSVQEQQAHEQDQPPTDPASTVRLVFYAGCTGVVAIVLGRGLGTTLFQTTTARAIALAVIALLVSVIGGLACEPILSRWDQRVNARRHRI